MHQPKPWFRASKNAWYVQIGRRQVSLGKDEAEAHRRFYRLMAEEGLDQARRPTADIQVAVLCDLYLDHSRRHHAPATYEWYRTYLQDFCDRYGGLGVAALRPLHVTRWLEAHGWGQSTRRGAIAIIKRVLSYALAEGYIREDPLRSLKKPPMQRREKILSAEEQQALFDATADQSFRDFLTALQETGARPGEVSSVTAADVDLEEGLWVLHAHKARAKTGGRVPGRLPDPPAWSTCAAAWSPSIRPAPCSATPTAGHGTVTPSAAGSADSAGSWGSTRAWSPTRSGTPGPPTPSRRACRSPPSRSCWDIAIPRWSRPTTPTSTRSGST